MIRRPDDPSQGPGVEIANRGANSHTVPADAAIHGKNLDNLQPERPIFGGFAGKRLKLGFPPALITRR